MKYFLTIFLFFTALSFAQVDTIVVPGYSTGTQIKEALDNANSALQPADTTSLHNRIARLEAINDSLMRKRDSTLYTTQNDLTVGLATRAPSSHSHSISGVTNLQDSLTAKLNRSEYEAGDTTGFWATVNALVTDALSDSDTLLATAETLDSLTRAFWAGTLGGGTFDSTFVYQRLAEKLAISDSATIYATLTMLETKLNASTYSSFIATFTGGTADQALVKVDSDDYDWYWATIGEVQADTIPGAMNFLTDVTDAALESYHTAYWVVAGCDSGRFYPASGDSLKSGLLGTLDVDPIWIEGGDTLYTAKVASATNSDTTFSIIYSSNGTPLDTFFVITVAPTPLGAEIIADDFETGDVSVNWTSETSAGSNTITVQTDSVQEGTYAAKFDFDGVNRDNYFEIATTDLTKVYISIQMNYNASFCGGAAWSTTPIISLMDGATEVCRMQTQANGTGTAINNLSLVGEGVGSPLYFGSDPNFYANDWQRVELIYRKGTTDGTGHFIFHWSAPGITDSDSMTTITSGNNFIDAIRIGTWDEGNEEIIDAGIWYIDDIQIDSTDNHSY